MNADRVYTTEIRTLEDLHKFQRELETNSFVHFAHLDIIEEKATFGMRPIRSYKMSHQTAASSEPTFIETLQFHTFDDIVAFWRETTYHIYAASVYIGSKVYIAQIDFIRKIGIKISEYRGETLYSLLITAIHINATDTALFHKQIKKYLELTCALLQRMMTYLSHINFSLHDICVNWNDTMTMTNFEFSVELLNHNKIQQIYTMVQSLRPTLHCLNEVIRDNVFGSIILDFKYTSQKMMSLKIDSTMYCVR